MNGFSTDLSDMIRSIGVQIISTLTLLICLVIALIRRKRHPKVSIIVAIALILLILHSFFFAFVDTFLSRWAVFSLGVPVDTYFWIAGLAGSITLAIDFAILLVGIFIDRKPAPPIGMTT